MTARKPIPGTNAEMSEDGRVFQIEGERAVPIPVIGGMFTLMVGTQAKVMSAESVRSSLWAPTRVEKPPESPSEPPKSAPRVRRKPRRKKPTQGREGPSED
jgi:hypothetical protein